ncbi:MAG TPA: Uma2 family endonuclease [Isosphaeraceae bacterium]|jgi:Uma2 family endonuclease|nr:Uma2 family endonuclease [Isosphaeraceae bacterium]
MSTGDRQGRWTLPPLAAGQRLDQPAFHARYEAMPPGTRAELIGGVVYMPSPLRDDHGWTSHVVSGWLFHYERFTPGVRGADNATTKLGRSGEPQPDSLLRIPEGAGGRSRVVVGFIVGTPELVVEVARSSRDVDLGPKRLDYERAGVLEHLFIGLDPNEVRWLALRGDRFEELPPGPDGLVRSEVFPGLWLDPAALFAGDLNALIDALERGLATPDHAAFVARLAGAGR